MNHRSRDPVKRFSSKRRDKSGMHLLLHCSCIVLLALAAIAVKKASQRDAIHLASGGKTFREPVQIRGGTLRRDLEHEFQSVEVDEVWPSLRVEEDVGLLQVPMRETLVVQLREQALPLLFRIAKTTAPVAVGQPVKVIVRTAQGIKGAAVLRSALTKVGAGETAVWVHIDAERFVARRVRHQSLDANNVAIAEGLQAGDRVVVEGAGLLSQVR